MARLAAFDWQIYDGCGQRKYLNEEEVLRFLRAANELCDARRALCYLLSNTGCRISEALALTRAQIDPVDGSVGLATLKRRKVFHRRVLLPEYLVRMLLALPVGADGRLWQMHRTTAWRCLSAAMHHADIHGPMATIRGLRHAFGIRCAEQAVIPSLIQRWMGHATLRMTMVYLDATGAEERRFASRVWWPVGPLTVQESPAAPPTPLPVNAIIPGHAGDALQLRQENYHLRQENARLRQFCDVILSAAQQLGFPHGEWRQAC